MIISTSLDYNLTIKKAAYDDMIHHVSSQAVPRTLPVPPNVLGLLGACVGEGVVDGGIGVKFSENNIKER